MSNEIDKKTYEFLPIATRLRVERERLSKSQEEIATTCGVSRVAWGMYERGKSAPSTEVFFWLAFLGADIFYILTGNRSPNKTTLTPAEEAIISNYRSASRPIQEFIEHTCAMAAAGKVVPV